jgi:acyl carrier protein
MEKKQIEKVLREILARRVPKTDLKKITLKTELATLGVDSLAYSWILADMEDAFGFVMKGSDIMKLKNLDDSIKYVETHLKKK